MELTPSQLLSAQIWRYSQGEMVDVTKEFPKVVYQSAADSWQMYSQIRQEYGAEAAQGAMAAYVASKFILGQEADAMKRLRQAYSDSSGKEFTSKLMSFLRQTGYASPPQSASPSPESYPTSSGSTREAVSTSTPTPAPTGIRETTTAQTRRCYFTSAIAQVSLQRMTQQVN